MGKPVWFGSLSYSSYITHYLFVKHHGEVFKNGTLLLWFKDTR